MNTNLRYFQHLLNMQVSKALGTVRIEHFVYTRLLVFPVSKQNPLPPQRQYAVDIRKMFPKELKEKILSQSKNTLDKIWSHIQLRHTNPVPPFIVEPGVCLP